MQENNTRNGDNDDDNNNTNNINDFWAIVTETLQSISFGK